MVPFRSGEGIHRDHGAALDGDRFVVAIHDDVPPGYPWLGSARVRLYSVADTQGTQSRADGDHPGAEMLDSPHRLGDNAASMRRAL
jgi:hypothetical protein